MQIVVLKVHNQKGEVVEDVACAERFIKFQRIERHRSPVDQHEVAEVQIAMAAAHATRFAAVGQQRRNPVKSLSGAR